MKLAAVMSSCPERAETRRQTLANFGATDWGADVEVVVDDGTGPTRVERIASTWRKALGVAAASDADVILMMEDDLEFNRNLRANVTSWSILADIDGRQPLFCVALQPRVLGRSQSAA